MASDEIKTAIVYYFGNKVISLENDWKRVFKRKLKNDLVLREFINAKLERTVYTLGEDEDASIIEKDVWIYGIACNPDFYGSDEGKFIVSFEPRDRWLRERALYDQHQSDIIELIFKLKGFDEVCENMFYPPIEMDEIGIRAIIEACGFFYDRELSHYMLNNTEKLVKIPATAPVNPPLPLLLQEL